MDNSKEGLMNNNIKKLSLTSSFDPISEKQEEMSIESMEDNIKSKTKNSNKNSIMNSKDYLKDISKDNTITKNILDDDNIKPLGAKKNKQSSKKSNYLNQIEEDKNNKIEEDNKKDSICKSFKRKKSKKKILQRYSSKEGGLLISNLSLNQNNNAEIKEKYLKKSSFRKKEIHQLSNSSLLNNNKSFHNQDNSYLKQNSIPKSNSNDNTLEINYINKISKKRTNLNKGKLDFGNKSKNNILEQIKNSDLFEKSDYILMKLKISYGVLAVFSLICIILNYADVIIYNNKSLEYLIKENNNTYLSFKNNIESYNYINKRKISSRENSIRVVNGIFSIICTLILIFIYYIRDGKSEKKKNLLKKKNLKKCSIIIILNKGKKV